MEFKKYCSIENSYREKENSNPDKKVKEPVNIADNILNLMNEAETFITENRLRNVLSHIGGVTEKEFGKVLGAFCKDILDDFSKENEEYNLLPNSDIKTINSNTNKKAAILIRNNWLNIVDGEF